MPNPILVDDDDDDSRELLGDLLRDQGHEVHAARNGKIALSMLAGLPPSCTVLLDLNMPEMGGELVLRALSLTGAADTFPVIVMSGDDRVIETPYPNIVARLCKPFDLGTLMRALAHAGPRGSPGG